MLVLTALASGARRFEVKLAESAVNGLPTGGRSGIGLLLNGIMTDDV